MSKDDVAARLMRVSELSSEDLRLHAIDLLESVRPALYDPSLRILLQLLATRLYAAGGLELPERLKDLQAGASSNYESRDNVSGLMSSKLKEV